jgi:predicted PolB exonuclease-like 3'-5' exonuclease
METIKNFKNTLFIDIETVSGSENFSSISDKMKEFWVKKAKNLVNPANISLEEMYFERAALYAEFGKIIVVGMGFLFVNKQGELSLKVKTIANADEKGLLQEFIAFINKTYKSRELTLVAHNGKEFDFPYLCRRMLTNGLEIPKSLQLQGKKPWEIIHQDTMEMWKFGDRRSYSSLELLAELMGIEGAKMDLSGDRVNHVFYKENGLLRIAAYCGDDVIIVAQLYLRFHFLSIVEPHNIEKL